MLKSSCLRTIAFTDIWKNKEKHTFLFSVKSGQIYKNNQKRDKKLTSSTHNMLLGQVKVKLLL